MTRATPELTPPSRNFLTTPAGGRLVKTCYLKCNRFHIRRIFSGIGFRTWKTPARRRDLNNKPPRSLPKANDFFPFSLLPTCLSSHNRHF
ncbi:hypothetical protein AVEN_176229-1 [Araneus ventricosus]|uniref:Uncharacterized protein n=1 Tax=Araneus ventricosus TaxID=182803 RepID=A0A4Y2Q9B6_ARAVE|nr:hypothetical protein AVEN_176229-1 [Araneus ventricosus]